MRPHYLLYNIFILIGCCCSSTMVLGQLPQNYVASRVYIPDFAANSSIRVVFQDHIGLIWVGTWDDGLYVWDGSRVEHFNLGGTLLEKGKISAIAEDENNNLWISCDGRSFILNPNRNTLVPQSQLGIPDDVPINTNFSVGQGPDNSLFFSAGTRIYHYRNHSISLWADLPSSMELTSNAKMLLYYNHSLLIHSNWRNEIIRVPQNGTAQVIWDKAHLHLSKVGKDSIVGIRSEADFSLSLFHYKTSNTEFSKSNQHEYINHSFIDPIRKVLAIEGQINLKTLSNWKIYPLKQDLWAVSCSAGLFLLRPVQELFNGIPASASQRIRGITLDKYNNLIYGTYNGLYWYNMNSGKSGLVTNDDTAIRSILATNNSNDYFIAFGESTPLKYFLLKSTPNRVKLDKVSSFNESRTGCNTMLKDNKGRGFVFLEKTNNVFAFNLIKPNGVPKQLPAKVVGQMPISEFRSMVQTNGIWLGSPNGLWYAAITESGTDTIAIRNHDIPETLRSLYINIIQSDERNNLWIGTKGRGLFYYNVTNKDIIQYTKQNGLADNTVFNIIQAKDSILWIGTGNGLSRLDLRKNWFQNYYKEDGLLDNEFNTTAEYLASNGTIYMGGQNGINYFSSADFRTDLSMSPLFITVLLNKSDDKEAIDKIYAINKSTIVVEPNTKLIEISFHSSDLANSPNIRFRYRIVDLDENWHYINQTDKTILTDLPIGKHQLEAQSLSYRGTWEPISTYYFTVLPPWYKTWWFRALVVLSIIALLYIAYQLRIRYLSREFELRQQISHDLHDSLGSRIFLLQSLSNKITNPLISEQERNEQLQKLETLSKDVFHSIRDFIWVFDPKHDDVIQLLDRMDDFAENYLSPLVKKIDVIRPEVQGSIKIGPRLKHHLINLYQELLTNMVKHTHSESLTISLDYQNRTIKIHIQNLHKGYVKNDNTKENYDPGYGLKSIQARIKEMNGTLEWEELNHFSQAAMLTVPI